MLLLNFINQQHTLLGFIFGIMQYDEEGYPVEQDTWDDEADAEEYDIDEEENDLSVETPEEL